MKNKLNTLFVVLLLGTIIMFSACGTSSGSNSNFSKKRERDYHLSTLAQQCDAVLSAGYDLNNDLYELVAEQTEDAKSFILEMGVVKNGKWLVPLSQDFPFLKIDEMFPTDKKDGEYTYTPIGELTLQRLRGLTLNYSYKVDSNALGNTFGESAFYYLGNGCFSIYIPRVWVWGFLDYNTDRTIIYNSETQKALEIPCHHFSPFEEEIADEATFYFEESAKEIVGLQYRVAETYYFPFPYKTPDNNKYVIDVFDEKNEEYNTFIFDENALELKKIATEPREEHQRVCPLVEGLFGREGEYSSNYAIAQFYNENNEVVIDLEQYGYQLVTNDDPIKDIRFTHHFENGTFTFPVKNPAGNYYIITIDKNGKVLSEEKVE